MNLDFTIIYVTRIIYVACISNEDSEFHDDLCSNGCRLVRLRGFQLWTNYVMCVYMNGEQLLRRHMPTMFCRALSVPLNTSLATPCHVALHVSARVDDATIPYVSWKMISTSNRYVPSRDSSYLVYINRSRGLVDKTDCTFPSRCFRWLFANRSNASRTDEIASRISASISSRSWLRHPENGILPHMIRPGSRSTRFLQLHLAFLVCLN